MKNFNVRKKNLEHGEKAEKEEKSFVVISSWDSDRKYSRR